MESLHPPAISHHHTHSLQQIQHQTVLQRQLNGKAALFPSRTHRTQLLLQHMRPHSAEVVASCLASQSTPPSKLHSDSVKQASTYISPTCRRILPHVRLLLQCSPQRCQPGLCQLQARCTCSQQCDDALQCPLSQPVVQEPQHCPIRSCL